MVDMKDEYIYLPQNITKLQHVNRYYNAAGLPCCVGSMDVVHVNWSNCPTGDYNHWKGEEGYPTFAFQCITDFNCRVLEIYGSAVPSRHYVGRTGYHIYGWSARQCRTHLGYTRKVEHQTGIL
jgi:hypothetical protein